MYCCNIGFKNEHICRGIKLKDMYKKGFIDTIELNIFLNRNYII